LDSYDDSSKRYSCGQTRGKLYGGMTGRTKDMLKIAGKRIMPKDVENVIFGIEKLTGNYRYVTVVEGGVESLKIKAEVDKDAEVTDELKEKVKKEIEVGLGVPVELKLAKIFKMERIIPPEKY